MTKLDPKIGDPTEIACAATFKNLQVLDYTSEASYVD